MKNMTRANIRARAHASARESAPSKPVFSLTIDGKNIFESPVTYRELQEWSNSPEFKMLNTMFMLLSDFPGSTHEPYVKKDLTKVEYDMKIRDSEGVLLLDCKTWENLYNGINISLYNQFNDDYE